METKYVLALIRHVIGKLELSLRWKTHGDRRKTHVTRSAGDRLSVSVATVKNTREAGEKHDTFLNTVIGEQMFDKDTSKWTRLPKQVFVLWSSITIDGIEEHHATEVMFSTLFNGRL